MKRKIYADPMIWTYVFTDGRIRYGVIKRGKRVVAFGIAERDGGIICRAVNNAKS